MIGGYLGAAAFVFLHRFYTGDWFNPKTIDGQLATEEEYEIYEAVERLKAADSEERG